MRTFQTNRIFYFYAFRESMKTVIMQLLQLVLFILTIVSLSLSGITDEPNCVLEDNVTVICNRIPKAIQPGILRIRVTGMKFVTNKEPIFINQVNFTSNIWSKVTYLEISDIDNEPQGDWTFENGCFSSLTVLKELHIHILYLDIFKDTFIGLDEVTVLDLRDCVRLERIKLLSALNGSDKLPKLRKLLLRNWNSYNLPYTFDETFVLTLMPRRITILDISSTQISAFNISAIFQNLKFLEVLNISYTNIGEEYHVNQNVMKPVRMIDLSHSVWPRQAMPVLPGVFLLSNISGTYSRSALHYVPFVFPATVLNVSRVISHSTFVFAEHATFLIDTNTNWFIKELILKQNNLKRLDIQVLCDDFTLSSIEHIDISDNGVEFIHPTILYCMPNLREVSLAKNTLFRMVMENRTLFEKLFLKLKYLKNIILSANDLHDIPLYTFTNCRNLQVIDLSNNKLSQITFLLNDVNHLEVLDLQKNHIKTLDQISLNRLNILLRDNKTKELQTKVILRSNPFTCSDCSTKPFIEWLISNLPYEVTLQNLTCSSENGNREIVTENTVKTVQKICDREATVILSAVSTIGLLLVGICVAVFMYKRQKHLKKIKNRAEVIDLLRQGQGRYEFMTFLSFCNEDEEFVETHILRQLNENLQQVTGIDRQLVCTGDRYFRPGVYVHDEVDRCLETVSVVILVISNNFCTSEYCCQEIKQACVKRKPVILMFIENVEVQMMTQRLKKLYERNVRLIWTREEDGQYHLKTTWENVCESMLELMLN